MFEVRGWVVDHADVLHDATRAEICRGGERDEAGKLERLKSVEDEGACAFSGEALTPVGVSETPANFYRGHKRSIKSGGVEADEADEFPCLDELGSVDAEAVALEVLLDSVDQLICLFRRQGGGEELHNARVGVECLEGLAV